VEAVTLSVTAPGDSPFSQFDNVPVSRPDGEVFWATPAAVVRQLPSMRLQLTLASAGETRAELGRYARTLGIHATRVKSLNFVLDRSEPSEFATDLHFVESGKRPPNVISRVELQIKAANPCRSTSLQCKVL
jgi:hypothetical protein